MINYEGQKLDIQVVDAYSFLVAGKFSNIQVYLGLRSIICPFDLPILWKKSGIGHTNTPATGVTPWVAKSTNLRQQAVLRTETRLLLQFTGSSGIQGFILIHKTT